MRIAVFPSSLDGGVPITPSQGFFTVNGKPVIRHGDLVLPHGPPPHILPPVISVRFFTCQSIPVTREMDTAACGHPVTNGEFPTIS